MTPKYARLPDRTVRYLDAGSGRTCILLHAFPLSADQWRPQLRRVPRGWRIVAPDLRGFRGVGQAFRDVGLERATVDSHAADVLRLLDHLDVDRAVVGGLSMGGYVTLALARAAPGRLDGVLLADTRAGADSDEGRAARDAMIAKVEAEGVAAIADAMVPKLLGATSLRERPDLVEAVRTLILRNTPEAIASAVGAMKTRPDSRPDLAGIPCAALVVCGTEDVLTPPAESEAMAAALPSATAVFLPGAGHLSNLEAPLAFTQALSAFLGRL